MIAFWKDDHSLRPKEGELYKIIDLYGSRFPIYYGYYEAQDRDNPAVDPMPLYPDFTRDLQFTPEGYPFVTKMQDACSYYLGQAAPEQDCADCGHYCHGEDLLGVCKCEHRRVDI